MRGLLSLIALSMALSTIAVGITNLALGHPSLVMIVLISIGMLVALGLMALAIIVIKDIIKDKSINGEHRK